VLADFKFKLGGEDEGLVYLAEPMRNLQGMQSHHHAELELNLVVQGTIKDVMNGRRFTFSPRTLLWLFPAQERQFIDRSEDARFYVIVFKPSLIDRSCHAAIYDGLKRAPTEQDEILSTVLDAKFFDLIVKSSIGSCRVHGIPTCSIARRDLVRRPTSVFSTTIRMH
jgi:AraC-like ligand binding domain